jgi:hypothetical protein
MRIRKQIVRKEPSRTQADDDQRYNGTNDSDQARVAETGKLDVIIPVQLPELNTGAARALLYLIIEAHRRKTLNSEQSTENM